MAVRDDVAGLFEQEWARFWQGWESLSAAEQEAEVARRARARSKAGLPNTVSLPGWDDVIHLTPRPTIGAAERTEFYAAQRERRPAELPAETIAEIGRRRDRAAVAASSAAPPYSAAFGQMLTALDNVQDFTTTVATLGRLALWPAIRTLDAITPRFGVEGWARSVFGASEAAATQLAKAASGDAAAAAWKASYAATLKEYELAARAGLYRAGLLEAGREAADLAGRAAGREAYALALKRFGAGIGTKVLGKLVPGLGWLLLAGDLFNLLAWLGTSGMIGYATACFGVRGGLSAGALPTLMRGLGGAQPCGLKGRVAALGDLNPFAAERKLDRSLRVARGLPSVGNLLETFQTTDQLWGVGVSFGAIVGSFTEGAYAAELASRGENVQVRSPASPLGTIGVGSGIVALQTRSKAAGAVAAGSLLLDTLGRTATAPLREKHKAAQILQNSAVINATQDTFTEVEHVEALICYAVALDLVASDLAGINWQDFLVARMPLDLAPPVYDDALTLQLVRELDPGLRSLGVWPVPGAPRVMEHTAFVEHFSREIPVALRNFLAPRRDGPVAMFAGGLVNLLTDKLYAMLEGDARCVRTRWAPEWRVLMALGESNRIPNVAVGEDALWRWWWELMELQARGPGHQLTAEDFDRVAEQQGVSLFLVEQAFLRTPL
jgi:hypothetical protein